MCVNLIKNITTIALCSLLGVTTGQAAQSPSPEQLMQGKWQSMREKGTILEVGGKTWSIHDISDKKPVRSTFTYQAQCEDGSKQACFAVSSKFDITYYHVILLQKHAVKLKEGEMIQSYKKLK
jgi:hypothetical protein